MILYHSRFAAVATAGAESVLMTSYGVTRLLSQLVALNGHQEGRHRITPGCPSISPLTATALTTPLTAVSRRLMLACHENGRIAAAASAAAAASTSDRCVSDAFSIRQRTPVLQRRLIRVVVRVRLRVRRSVCLCVCVCSTQRIEIMTDN